MKFNRSLGSAELRPVEDRKAEIDHRTVQAEELVLESELASTNQALTSSQQTIKDLFEHRSGSVGIGVRKRRTRWSVPQPQLL
jgi:hypothetical protein